MIKGLADAIEHSKFMTVVYHAKGEARGRGDARMVYGDRISKFQAQTGRYDNAIDRSVEGLRVLDVAPILAGLSPRVLTRDYQPPKGKAKDWPDVVTETLTVEDLRAARDRAVAKLLDPEGRARDYTQRAKWEQVKPGIFRKIEAPEVLALRVFKKDGSTETITPPVNGWHVANSARESRANEVIRRWTRAGDIRTVLLDRIVSLAAGGRRWERAPGGDLRVC